MIFFTKINYILSMAIIYLLYIVTVLKLLYETKLSQLKMRLD